MKHPKPWKVKKYAMNDRYYYIEDAAGNIVQDSFLGNELALEIVAAVNSREKLVEALKGFVDGECHCHEVGMRKPCVQCVGREALSELERLQ